IVDFDEAICLDPKYTWAYNNRALAYRRKGDLNRAIADASEAIRLDPKYAWAYNNRALAYRRKGDLNRAIADATEATAPDPNYTWPTAHRAARTTGRASTTGPRQTAKPQTASKRSKPGSPATGRARPRRRRFSPAGPQAPAAIRPRPRCGPRIGKAANAPNESAVRAAGFCKFGSVGPAQGLARPARGAASGTQPSGFAKGGGGGEPARCAPALGVPCPASLGERPGRDGPGQGEDRPRKAPGRAATGRSGRTRAPSLAKVLAPGASHARFHGVKR